MKHKFLKSVISAICAVLSFFLFAACGEEHFEGKITGSALVMQQTDDGYVRLAQVHDGQQVLLRIGATETQPLSLGMVVISGTSYTPNLHYFIDDKEVACTRNDANLFEVPYTVNELSKGTHTITATVDDDFKNITYIVNIASSKFEVIE